MLGSKRRHFRRCSAPRLRSRAAWSLCCMARWCHICSSHSTGGPTSTPSARKCISYPCSHAHAHAPAYTPACTPLLTAVPTPYSERERRRRASSTRPSACSRFTAARRTSTTRCSAGWRSSLNCSARACYSASPSSRQLRASRRRTYLRVTRTCSTCFLHTDAFEQLVPT